MDVLQLIYEDQIERLREKEVKEAKKRQRLGDNFLDLLYSIKVSILPMCRVHASNCPIFSKKTHDYLISRL